MKPNHKLPTPTEDAQQRSLTLQQKIKQMLNRHGSLTFARFMEMALYTPALGYYSGGLPKIGREGDFVTAPEISPLFSRCIARQAMQVLSELSTPNLVEFGAGKGTMAKDILLELAEQKKDLEHYYIIELSADLKLRQQETLRELPEEWQQKVVWLEQLPQQPIEACIVANEVLDAMPVEKLRLEPENSQHAFVTYNDNTEQFEWAYQAITDRTLQNISNGILELIGTPPKNGYETEVNLNIHPWLQSIADFLDKGSVILVDYGYTRREYYQPSRNMGTLRCHYQHLAHSDPFFYPGLQDLTAHVDFTSVAESAFDSGFKIAGFTTQAHFLMGSGLLEMSGDAENDLTKSLQIAQQIKTLTLPNEMGESFKVIALTKNIDMPLLGFQYRDLRHQL